MLLDKIESDPKVNKQLRIHQSTSDLLAKYVDYYNTHHKTSAAESEVAELILQYFMEKDKQFKRWEKKEEAEKRTPDTSLTTPPSQPIS